MLPGSPLISHCFPGTLPPLLTLLGRHWPNGLRDYMPLLGSDGPGKNWRLNAALGITAWEQDAFSSLLGGSPALSLALVQSGSKARRDMWQWAVSTPQFLSWGWRWEKGGFVKGRSKIGVGGEHKAKSFEKNDGFSESLVDYIGRDFFKSFFYHLL